MGQDPEKALKLLNDKIYEIQKKLNRRIEMKFVPKIHFRLDKSGENVAKIDKLLKREKKDLG
jgi:ribosome-binding factor A